MARAIVREIRTSTGVELVITEPITQWTAERIISQLSAYKGEKVTLSIFSGGGDAFAGFAIYDYITAAENALDVEARVYGMAASAAMIIAAGCSPRLIGESSMAMIHNAFSMEAEPDEKTQAVLDSMNERQLEIFSKLTGKRKDSVKKLMDEDRFMDADEAVSLGLFTGTIAQAKLAALLTNKPMSEKQTRSFKVSAADALKAIASGAIEVPESEIASADADKVKALDEQIANITKERDELKAAKEAAETAKAAAEAEKATAEAAKVDAEAKVTAATELAGKYQAALDALKKNPLVAQVMPDGTQIVVPGAPTPPPTGPALSERDKYVQEAANYFQEAKARMWGKKA